MAEIPEPPEVAEIKSYPLRNASDDAWAELQSLREQATNLGVRVDEAWPIVRLREEIAKVGGEDRDRMAAAFAEWDRRYRDDPKGFNEDWHASSTATEYGERAADYFLSVLRSQLAEAKR